MWRKGLACGQQALDTCTGRDGRSTQALRGLVSEEGPSPTGEAGKEGWLNVNVQDGQRERTGRGRGKLIVCKLKKYRVKVTLSFIFSMVPTTRLHGGRQRNEQAPTSWVMTRKKATNRSRKLV